MYDYYYGAIYYDLWSYPNGNIRAKYFYQVTDVFGPSFGSLTSLEYDAFDSIAKDIDREMYNITVIYNKEQQKG